MQVIRMTPRGYCHGVVGAMRIVQETIENPRLPRPIYIVGMIVHNQHVVDAFDDEGVITLDGASRLKLLEQVDKGTVVFTAHGVSPMVKRLAAERGLYVIDATCPDVTRTHDLIRDRVALGYDIVYIGRKGHPEPEGACGIAPGHVYLVETEADIEALQLDNPHIAVTNQTTLSQWDTAALMERIQEKYPQAEVYNEICMATQTRQQAVAEQASQADLCIVVGDRRSNNSNRLKQVSEEIAGTPARLISDVSQIQPEWLRGLRSVAVTSGASTPSAITKAVIDYLEQFDGDDPATWQQKNLQAVKHILPKVYAPGTGAGAGAGTGTGAGTGAAKQAGLEDTVNEA